MKNGIKFIFLLATVFLSGCVTIPVVSLRPGAEAVKVGKADPLDNYQEVGPVSGYDGKGCGGFGYYGTYERAVTDIKNRAYEKGADYIQIFTITEPHLRGDCFDNLYKLSGTAYKKVRDMPSPTPIVNKPTGNDALVEKMRFLKQLRDEGLITEKQFEEKRQQLLK
ncbi:MAG: hypothetical protein HY035_08950 [Nitrospirae bacterium]|nr:hypothetical protein [Nitrospirota bacterium]